MVASRLCVAVLLAGLLPSGIARAQSQQEK